MGYDCGLRRFYGGSASHRLNQNLQSKSGRTTGAGDSRTSRHVHQPWHTHGKGSYIVISVDRLTFDAKISANNYKCTRSKGRRHANPKRA